MHFVHFNEIQEAKKNGKSVHSKRKQRKQLLREGGKQNEKKTHKLNCKKKPTTMIPFAELNIKISKY